MGKKTNPKRPTPRLYFRRWLVKVTPEPRLDGNTWYTATVRYTIHERSEIFIERTAGTVLTAVRLAWLEARAEYDEARTRYLLYGYPEAAEDLSQTGQGHVITAWRHLLARTRRGEFHCAICGYTFQFLPSNASFACPGMMRYTWDNRPAHLKTKTELYAAGYSTGKTKLPQAEGVIAFKNPHQRRADWTWLHLYDEAQAVQRETTPEQVRQMKKASRSKGYVGDILKVFVEAIQTPGWQVVVEYRDRQYWMQLHYEEIQLSVKKLGKSQKQALAVAADMAGYLAQKIAAGGYDEEIHWARHGELDDDE
jgi:hypothetical protein